MVCPSHSQNKNARKNNKSTMKETKQECSGKGIVLGITLDHEDAVYRVQHWIKGRVVVSALHDNTDVDGASARLQIRLVGKERTWQTARRFLHSDKHSNKKTLKENTVFEDTRDIYEFGKEEVLPQGMKSYPFSIFLPHDLAPSMSFEDPNSSRGEGCDLSYKLLATLGTDLVVERELSIVGGACAGKLYPHWIAPVCLKTSPSASMSSLDETPLVLCAKVDNTHIAKGDKIAVSLACRNFSSLNVQRVNIRLEEHVQWGGRCQHHHVKVLNELYDAELEERMLERADHSDSSSSFWKDSEHGPVANSILCAEMTADVHSVSNRRELKVPSYARDSYPGGKLLRVLHRLCITLVTNRRKNPHVEIPLTIQPMSLTRPSPSMTHHKTAANAVWPDDAAPTRKSQAASDEKQQASSFPPIKEVPVV